MYSNYPALGRFEKFMLNGKMEGKLGEESDSHKNSKLKAKRRFKLCKHTFLHNIAEGLYGIITPHVDRKYQNDEIFIGFGSFLTQGSVPTSGKYQSNRAIPVIGSQRGQDANGKVIKNC